MPVAVAVDAAGDAAALAGALPVVDLRAVLDGVVVEMPTALRDALPAVSHHAGLPGTDLPSFCRGKYGYNTLNMASYSLNGYMMQNHRVRPSDLK